jgi:hypothetical protein
VRWASCLGEVPCNRRAQRAAAGLQREVIDGDIGLGRGGDADCSGNVSRLAAELQVRLPGEPDVQLLADRRVVIDISTR